MSVLERCPSYGMSVLRGFTVQGRKVRILHIHESNAPFGVFLEYSLYANLNIWQNEKIVEPICSGTTIVVNSNLFVDFSDLNSVDR